MTISMYAASVPVFARTLTNLSRILDKAIADADARKVDAAVYGATRLFPDMLPLTSQVQIACDTAKGAAARLAGAEIPSFRDEERTLADLKGRIDKTLAFLATMKPEQIDGSEQREVVLKVRDGDLRFNGQQYLLGFALPNFFFHVSTAYNLLRHNGVPIGKRDYLGNP